MHRGLVTCPPEARLGDAASLLVGHRVHALVVADSEGRPLGVLSDTDLLAGEWLSTDAEGLEVMLGMTAGELMTAPPETIDAGASASEAAARLRRRHILRLLVTEGGRPTGVISVSDLVASLAHASTERRCVADVMSRGIVVCAPDTPVSAAARAMTERRSRSIVVVDSSGRPVGVVTGFDLLALYQPGAAATTVDELMQSPLTIGPDASLREAADLMLRHETHRLVVVDPEHPDAMPLGLVSTSDLVAEMAEPGSVWQDAAS
jgi:CBS domain-containing protein